MRPTFVMFCLAGIVANLMAVLPSAHAERHCIGTPASETKHDGCCKPTGASHRSDSDNHKVPTDEDHCRDCSFCKIAPAGAMVVLAPGSASGDDVVTEIPVIGEVARAACPQVPPVPPPRLNPM